MLNTSTLAKTSDHINYLTIVDESGHEQTIETTGGHPFWVVTDEPDLSRAARDYSDGMYHGNLDVTENGYWVEAKDLRVGDVFLGANGEISTLTNIVRIEQAGGIAVFNFTVERNHNYFILAKDFEYGQSCILVHNAKNYYREPTKKSIRNWEEANGQTWPKDPDFPNHNQIVSHKVPLADGGTNHTSNIEPLPRKVHTQQHVDNGDFARWAQLANKPKKIDPGLGQ